MARENNLHTLPVSIFRHLLVDEVFELLRQLSHECCPWRNTVAVERLLFWHFLPLTNRFFSSIFNIESCAESSCALLVHLSSGGNPINGHEEELMRLNLPKKMLDVVKYRNEHLLLGHTESRIVGVLVGAIVDNTVHIQLMER